MALMKMSEGGITYQDIKNMPMQEYLCWESAGEYILKYQKKPDAYKDSALDEEYRAAKAVLVKNQKR